MKAFTLVELLAVIVIIASMAALLFPVLVDAKEHAKAGACLHNLKTAGIAKDLYLIDYEDHYPLCVNYFERSAREIAFGRKPSEDPASFPTPVQALGPYARHLSVFRCPLDHGAALGRSFRAYPFLFDQNGESSYLFAELYHGQTSSIWRDPGNCIWASDADPIWHTDNYDLYDLQRQAVQAVFQDGHVKLAFNRNAPTAIE